MDYVSAKQTVSKRLNSTATGVLNIHVVAAFDAATLSRTSRHEDLSTETPVYDARPTTRQRELRTWKPVTPRDKNSHHFTVSRFGPPVIPRDHNLSCGNMIVTDPWHACAKKRNMPDASTATSNGAAGAAPSSRDNTDPQGASEKKNQESGHGRCRPKLSPRRPACGQSSHGRQAGLAARTCL